MATKVKCIITTSSDATGAYPQQTICAITNGTR